MPFTGSPADYPLCWPDVTLFSSYQDVPYRDRPAGEAFGVSNRTLHDVRIGQTTYQLRTPTEGTFTPTPERGEFVVAGFGRAIVGLGATPKDAYEDWLKQFHWNFQRLYVMRPFEMDDAEQKLWAKMEGWVDVEQYRVSRPLVVLQHGKVYRARPYPQLIQWEDGTRERVHLSRMPGEFAAYKAGQPFEALVHRDPVTHKLLKVEYVKRLKGRPKAPGAEEEALWDSLPTSAGLPDSDWD